MTEDRDARIERYYNESAWDLAGWLVDAEDQIKIWTPRIERLRALEAAGVDNWSGYDAAMDILYSYDDEADTEHTCPDGEPCPGHDEPVDEGETL